MGCGAIGLVGMSTNSSDNGYARNGYSGCGREPDRLCSVHAEQGRRQPSPLLAAASHPTAPATVAGILNDKKPARAE